MKITIYLQVIIPLSVECRIGFAKCMPEREHPALGKLQQ